MSDRRGGQDFRDIVVGDEAIGGSDPPHAVSMAAAAHAPNVKRFSYSGSYVILIVLHGLRVKAKTEP